MNRLTKIELIKSMVKKPLFFIKFYVANGRDDKPKFYKKVESDKNLSITVTDAECAEAIIKLIHL